MKKVAEMLVAEMVRRGVVCKVECFPGEGYNLRVFRLADTFPAEEVAREYKAKFGLDICVAF